MNADRTADETDEAERDLPRNEEDTQLYMLFETNHPDIDVPGDDESSEREQTHKSRPVAVQKHWIIENGSNRSRASASARQ